MAQQTQTADGESLQEKFNQVRPGDVVAWGGDGDSLAGEVLMATYQSSGHGQVLVETDDGDRFRVSNWPRNNEVSDSRDYQHLEDPDRKLVPTGKRWEGSGAFRIVQVGDRQRFDLPDGLAELETAEVGDVVSLNGTRIREDEYEVAQLKRNFYADGEFYMSFRFDHTTLAKQETLTVEYGSKEESDPPFPGAAVFDTSTYDKRDRGEITHIGGTLIQ